MEDEVYRRARVKAAEQDTSVSALVRRFLVDLAAQGSEFERLEQLEQTARQRIIGFSASDRLTRDALYDRQR